MFRKLRYRSCHLASTILKILSNGKTLFHGILSGGGFFLARSIFLNESSRLLYTCLQASASRVLRGNPSRSPLKGHERSPCLPASASRNNSPRPTCCPDSRWPQSPTAPGTSWASKSTRGAGSSPLVPGGTSTCWSTSPRGCCRTTTLVQYIVVLH